MHISIHILGSQRFSGTAQFFIHLARGLRGMGQQVLAIDRENSAALHALEHDEIERLHLPLAGPGDLWSAFRIKRIAAQLQPCIVQTYLGPATHLTRVSRKSGVVHIARVGGYDAIDRGYHHAHAWVGSSKGICDYMIKSGLPAERIHHIGNLVPIAGRQTKNTRLSLREQYGIGKDQFVIFAQGRLVESKGIDVLLRAFARLPEEIGGRPLLLVIVGDGPEEAALKKLAEDIGLVNRVLWARPSDPQNFLAVSDLAVCPAREDTQGKAILDAWSYGLPVVSTATQSAKELIQHEISGLLAQPCYPASLAAHMKSAIVATVAVRASLGRTGEGILRHQFSPETVVSAYIDLYQQLLSERGF